MFERFPCGLFQPPGVKVFGVSDKGVYYGDDLIQYSIIDAINIITAPTPLTNGVANMVAFGKTYTLCYRFADRERAAKALGYAKQKLAEAKGASRGVKYTISAHTGTTLDVYETYLVINFVRTGGLGTIVANAASGGSTGGKRINFADITAIQFKEPAGMTVGFIQFAYPGSREVNGSVIAAINDENSVPVSVENLPTARAIVRYVEERRVAMKTPQTTVVQQISVADELKKFKELLDMGIITEEEFRVKKEQLLKLL